jgi:lipid-binding SYLF domain-containing protein
MLYVDCVVEFKRFSSLKKENLRRKEKMNREKLRLRLHVTALVVVLVLFMTVTSSVRADDKLKAQGIVDKSKVTLNAFMSDNEFVWLQKNIKKAKGVLIYPQVLKAGFILGGSGGTGVFLAHDLKTGDWSQPAFYTVGAASFGLQIGGESAETMILAMTQKAVDALYTTSVKLGGDTSVALGPVGTGAKANIMADFIAFSKTKGAYAGLNLEGSVVGVRGRLNKAYYGEEASPVQIIVEKKVSNKGSDQLREDLKKAAK